MGVYDRAAATTLKLITKYGRDISVVKSSDTAVDATKPWRGTVDAYTDTTPDSIVVTKGVFVPISSAAELGFIEVYPDGGTLARGEQICLVAASGLVDLTEHEGIRDGGTNTWKILRLMKLKPGADTLLYAFEVTQ